MIWQGVDREGVKIIIDEDAWKRHVMKHPEIEPFWEAVAKTMCNPEKIYQNTRPDEQRRYFRRLYRSGLLSGYFVNHYVRVAVKYVRFAHRRLRLTVVQPNGEVVGFYSSSWFQRQISEPYPELERIHPKC